MIEMESEIAADPFPAHAGMNRLLPLAGFPYRAVPRARGDEPTIREELELAKARSPRTRG